MFHCPAMSVQYGLLPMLGYWPADDAQVLLLSGPALTLAQTRQFCVQRLMQMPVVLQHWAQWSAALQASDDQCWTEHIRSPFWRQYALDVAEPWRQLPLATYSLPEALSHWQRLLEALWPSRALQLPSALLTPIAAVNTQEWLTAPLAFWAQERAEWATRAGLLSARLLSIPVTPSSAQRRLIAEMAGAKLFRYAGDGKRPILLVFATVNSAEVLDLNDQHSLLQALQRQGFTPYLLDWSALGRQGSGLDIYEQQALPMALDVVCANSGQKQSDVLGVCQGGAFCLQAFHQSAKVRALHLLATPLDYQCEQDFLTQWAKNSPLPTTPPTTEMPAISPGALNVWFAYLKPFALRPGKLLNWLQRPPSDAALSLTVQMEHWLLSGPMLSSAALTQYRQRCISESTSLTSDIPVQLLVADQDHIVPPTASLNGAEQRFKHLRVQRFATGHIGLLMGRAHRQVAETIAHWPSA